MISASRVRELLDYNPITGALRWRGKQGLRAGARGGSVMTNGYRYIQIDNKLYIEARVIWLLMTGKWPRENVSYVDGNPLNMAWKNLREVSNSQRNAGERLPKNNFW
jgi:HNH endonuclease